MKKVFFAAILLTGLTALVHSQPENSQLVVAGLSRPVTVQRDGRGIPYIKAANEKDLYFAQGYITAGDRLWQMDLLRRVARGETAEIFGERALAQDKRFRRFGFALIAEKSVLTLSPQLREALNAYAAGVNAYVSTLDAKTLPPEFQILGYRPRPWEATDTIVVGKILADALSTTWSYDLLEANIRKTLPANKVADLRVNVTPYDVVLYGKDVKIDPRPTRSGVNVSGGLSRSVVADAQIREAALTQVGLFADELAASNNWVISGKRSADGKPILANDPHLAASAPGIWYLSELASPAVHVAGVTIPGVPGIILGHNDAIAWGATNVGPDVQDVYLETFNEKGEVKTPDGWKAPNVRRENILVRKGFSSPDTETVVLDVVETHNGVIITDEGDEKYSLKWTAFDPNNAEFEAFFQLDRAKDWTSFKDALKTYGGPAQNFVYADVKGHIGWYAAGRIPIRRKGDGSLPYDGSTRDGDWVANIPFDELPHLFDPPSGLIVTANQRIVGTSYKYQQISRGAAAPWRARRILDMLSAKKALGMDDVRDVQLSAYNIPLVKFSEEIQKRGAVSPSTLAELKKWDGEMEPQSHTALLIDSIRNCVTGKMADAFKPAPASMIRERVLLPALQNELNYWLPPNVNSFNDLIKGCDDEQSKKIGADRTWGSVFVSNFPHPLAGLPLIGKQFATPSVGIAGSGQSPNVGSSVSMRLIASPGNWDATRHLIPLGESGLPSSPHYKDQFDLWRLGTPAAFPFSDAAVSAAAKATVVLNPR